MNRRLERRRVAKYWKRQEREDRKRAWTRRHDGTHPCVQECCAYPDGTPRWIDRDGKTLGPVPPPGHEYHRWNDNGRPPAAPWGSYLDETPLPRHPGRNRPLSAIYAAGNSEQNN